MCPEVPDRKSLPRACCALPPRLASCHLMNGRPARRSRGEEHETTHTRACGLGEDGGSDGGDMPTHVPVSLRSSPSQLLTSAAHHHASSPRAQLQKPNYEYQQTKKTLGRPARSNGCGTRPEPVPVTALPMCHHILMLGRYHEGFGVRRRNSPPIFSPPRRKPHLSASYQRRSNGPPGRTAAVCGRAMIRDSDPSSKGKATRFPQR